MKKNLSAFILSAFAGIQFSIGDSTSGSILMLTAVISMAYADFAERLDNE